MSFYALNSSSHCHTDKGISTMIFSNPFQAFLTLSQGSLQQPELPLSLSLLLLQVLQRRWELKGVVGSAGGAIHGLTGRWGLPRLLHPWTQEKCER